MKTSFGAMTGRERLCFVLKYLFMALCVVVALFPIIWVILSSFKTNAEILSTPSRSTSMTPARASPPS